MDYTSKYLTIQDLKDRLNHLVGLGYGVEPEDADDGEAWDLYNECHTLQEVESDLSYCWKEDNTTLIHTDKFDEYTRDVCVDLGDIKQDSFLMELIDWDKAAEHILQDYKRVNLPEGNDYWVRA